MPDIDNTRRRIGIGIGIGNRTMLHRLYTTPLLYYGQLQRGRYTREREREMRHGNIKTYGWSRGWKEGSTSIHNTTLLIHITRQVNTVNHSNMNIHNIFPHALGKRGWLTRRALRRRHGLILPTADAFVDVIPSQHAEHGVRGPHHQLPHIDGERQR